jgi:hypothetical protein
MARRLLGTLPVALGLLVVACADQNDSSPTAPHAGWIAAVVTSPACNFSGFNSLIAQYFTNNARKQKASGFVNDMQVAGGAVDAGFNLLAEIAQTVDSTYNGLGTSGSTATGNSLVRATIACMFDDLGTLPDFTVSVDPASKGAFQVVGGASDASSTPVLARSAIGSEPISAVAPTPPPPTVPPAPPAPPTTWGAIVKTADGTAFTRALIYGKPVLVNSIPDPLQYQWEAIRPDISFASPGAVVAICAADGSTDWIQESGLVGQLPGILAYQPAADFCVERPDPSLQIGFFSGGWRPSLLARRLIRSLSPEPLNAAVLLKSTGGTAGGLHSIFSKKAVPSATLKFVAPFPSSTPKVNTPITVFVEARDVDKVLMNGVTVTIIGTSNKGFPTNLLLYNGTSCSTSTGTPSGVTGTAGTGLVQITFCDTKVGGLSANATGDAVPETGFTPGVLKLNVKP